MATQEDLARLDGRLLKDSRWQPLRSVATLNKIQLRLDSMEHRIASRNERFEGELSRLCSAVYLLGKDRPDIMRLLGNSNS